MRILLAITALLLSSPVAAQSLTLTNLKAPIAKASGKPPAKSIKDLWTQINGLPAPAPASQPVPIPPSTPLSGILSEGDSISILWGGSHTGIYAKARPTVMFSGKAVGGSRISDVTGGNGLVQRLDADLATRPAIVTVFIGANDLGDGSYPTTGAWLDAFWGYVAKVKATGAKVAVGTILPQCNYSRHNERRAVVNTVIRAAIGSKIDAVIDFAADPIMGVDAAACDTTLYKDGLHPTDGGDDLSGGQGKLARIYINALDRLNGTSEPVAQPMTITPIASNFDTVPFIVPGYSKQPPSAAPDVLGAFRFICTPGQLNYDDPILYPGVKGGSPHPHQWYGNTEADWRSTYATLRTTGDSTCSNKLNRSAYWVPALMNAAGKVIQPDYLSIYYKRHADGDPACLRESAKGCVGIPPGLRVVSGYDMKRMGQVQPENITFHHRCISPGKPSVHRSTIAEAVADCGGAGQIMTAINFGSCWNGMLDSADHRSHLTHAQYIGQAYAQCPVSHPYIIPELTQQIAYTVTSSDGSISFSSDLMPGMKMPGGSTFHADYMEAWDPTVRSTWENTCIGKMLNCSDGELGDGTMLKRGLLNYLATPRLLDAPIRN